MATPQKTTKFKGELGGSGITVYNGVVSDVEYLAELNTEYSGQGLKTLDRMRKSDPIIQSTLQVIKLGILQGEWDIEGIDGQDEVTEFIEEALFERMDKPFHEVLWDILTYLDFGFYVCEKVFKVEEDKIWIAKLAYRDQKSITRFETEDHKPGITQILQGDNAKDKGSSTVSIPMEKLLIFTNAKEGDNWRGVSILRSAYKPWFWKENFEKIDAVGFEREAVGIPVFKMPPNPDPKDSEMADELGQNIRANEKAYLKLPNGWEFEVIYPQGGQRRGADEPIKRFNRDIVANVLAHFLDLGAGSTGSRALSNDQSDAFYRSLQSRGDYIASIFNSYVIPQLIDLNFNGIVDYPKLKVGGIEKTNPEVFTTALQRLTLAGLLTADPELEDFVRTQLRLPALPKEIKEQKLKIQEDETNPLNPNNPDNLKNNPLLAKGLIDKSGKNTNKKEKDKDKGQGKSAKEIRKTKKAAMNEEEGFWRPLTLAEQKINFNSLRNQMDRMEAIIKIELPKVLAPEIVQLLDTAKLAVQMQDAKRVEDITIRFKDQVRIFVIDRMRVAFEAGKLSAANELDVLAPKTTNELINLITTRANAIADQITSQLLNTAKLNTIDYINRSVAAEEAMRSLNQALEDIMGRTIPLTASILTVGGINDGRLTVFDQYPEKIYALQRSEVLDTQTCNYCLSLDGRVVQKGDNITKHGPFHFNCRGIWVEILEDEPEKPDIGGVPQQLRDNIGTLTEFEQLNKPMPLAGSLADEFVKNK